MLIQQDNIHIVLFASENFSINYDKLADWLDDHGWQVHRHRGYDTVYNKEFLNYTVKLVDILKALTTYKQLRLSMDELYRYGKMFTPINSQER